MMKLVRSVQDQVLASADGMHERGDPAYRVMLQEGVDQDLRSTAAKLDDFVTALCRMSW